MPRSDPSILHVDMDAFYAAVEVLQEPTLKGRPVIVGGSGARGVVASCSYEARAYGIHSAMPSLRAKRLCPDAVFLHGNFDLYADYSRRIHDVFLSFTPLVEGISLDEAFLDVAGAQRLFGDGPAIGHAVRGRVRDEVGLDCSVGVATSKFVAKLASKAAKPTATPAGPRPGVGVKVVAPGAELEFLHPLPVRALWGVGPATERRLSRLGILTVGDLARAPLSALEKGVGVAAGRHLHDLAWGRDDRSVEPSRPAKSIGHEETYANDIDDADRLGREVVRMADAVAARLRAADLVARTVTLKVRFGDFRTITRSETVVVPIDTGHEVASVGRALLAHVDVTPGVRLLGLSVSHLDQAEARQLTLDDFDDADPTGSWQRATDAVDRVRDRFGDSAVGPASLVAGGELRVKRQGDTQWGPRPDGGSAD